MEGASVDAIKTALEEIWGKPLTGAIPFREVVMLARRVHASPPVVGGGYITHVTRDDKWPDTLNVHLNWPNGNEVEIKLPLKEE